MKILPRAYYSHNTSELDTPDDKPLPKLRRANVSYAKRSKIATNRAKTLVDPFLMGYDSYTAGWGIKENPISRHKSKREDRALWYKGYRKALQEDRSIDTKDLVAGTLPSGVATASLLETSARVRRLSRSGQQ